MQGPRSLLIPRPLGASCPHPSSWLVASQWIPSTCRYLFEGRLEALAWEQGWGVGGARRHSPSLHTPHSFVTTTCLCPQFMKSFLLRCLLPFHGNSRTHAEAIAGPHSAVRKRSRDPPKITEQDPQCRVGLLVWCAVH